MREPLDKLMEKLGVGHVLTPYETYPWFLYDEVKGITCSAEVRMGGGGTDLEAEIQFLHDEKDEDEDSGQGDESGGHSIVGGREQIMWMRIEPFVDGQWTPKKLRIKGKDYVNEFNNWEGKGCDFFRACVEAIQMSELPDIDALIDEHMKDDTMWGSGRRGRIGRKSPKVKPGQLMGMKK